MSNSRPFPWTNYVPESGDHAKPGGCGCSDGGLVKLIEIPNFGKDTEVTWGKLSRNFGGKFAIIGPQSEWDTCVLSGSSVGDIVVGVGAPVVIPMDTDITIRPHRSFGLAVRTGLLGKLQLLVMDKVPAWAPHKRAPRIYPYMNSANLSSAVETTVFLNTAIRNGSAVGLQQNLIVAGSKSFSLYLVNASETESITWRLYGTRQDDGDIRLPISPNGYPDNVPTYNTLSPLHYEAWHYDTEENALEHVFLVAKGNNVPLKYGVEVRD